MELQLFALEDLQAYLICLARAAALVAAMPALGTNLAPARVRLGLAALLSLLVFPLVAEHLPRQALSALGLAFVLAQEVTLGIMVAFVARFIFTAVEMGGSVIGYQMGFAAANVFDPQTKAQTPLISRFQSNMALLIFLALDFHYLFLRMMVRSYELLPPGHLNLGGDAVPFLLRLSANMFGLGVQLAAPILAVLLLSAFILGILSRIFPQLNAFMLSFPVNIGTGLLVMGLTLSLVGVLLSREFGALEERLAQLFQLL